MRARAPASSANLGPGFDTLAVAIDRYVEVTVTPADRLLVETSGYGADLPADATHLAARLATEIAGTDELHIVVHSDIPVGRGLGSSAALAVAAAAAAGSDDPLHWGVVVDGHPENAAASAVGGLIGAATIRGAAVARRLALDPAIRFVVIVPDRPLPTAEARAALAATVGHEDASFNLGRLVLLLAGLADHRQLTPDATADRLHQDARARLFPEAPALLAGLVDAGALASCWSGAGPSLLAVVTPQTTDAVADAAGHLVAGASLAAHILQVAPDVDGVVVTP